MEYLWIDWRQGNSEMYPMIMPMGWRVSMGESESPPTTQEIFEQANKMVELYNRELHRLNNIS